MLEGIATELQILIIQNISDFDALRNLVYASPACHRAYTCVRQEVLFRLAHLQCKDDRIDIAEAWVAIRSKGFYAQVEENKKEILTLLDYRRRPNEIRQTQGDSAPWGQLTLEDCIELLHMRRQFNFLLRDCCQTLPHPPFLEDDECAERLPLCPSEDERTRFLRAFYRLQTYSNIFGVPENCLNIRFSRLTWRNHTYSEEDVWTLFFSTMPPWEAEEIGCVAAYVRQKYVKIFAEIADDLSEHGPRYKDVEPWDSDGTSCELYPTSRCFLTLPNP